MIERKLIALEVTDPRLPWCIDVPDDAGGIVIGNDLARVNNLRFRLDALRPCRGGWRSHTLRDLACEDSADVLLGNAEYKQLLSQELRLVAADMLRVRTKRTALPKSETLIEYRLRPPNTAAWTASPGARVIEHTDSTVGELKYQLNDDAMAVLARADRPPQIPVDEFFVVLSIVVVATGGMSHAEHELIMRIFQTGILAPRVHMALIADNIPRNFMDGPVCEEVTQFHSPPQDDSYRLRLRHVEWESDSLDGYLRLIHRLATQVVGYGGRLSDITVVTSGAVAALARQNLVEAGVPVLCSENHLLAMRPGVLTVMALLAAVDGCGRLQAASRLLEVWPFLNHVGIRRFCGILENLDGWPSETDDHVGYRVTEFLEALKPLLRAVNETGTQQAVQAALALATRLVPRRQQEDIKDAAAITAWASTHTKVSAMLREYWRLRARYSGWSGYKPGSGIAVVEQVPQNSSSIVVLLLPEKEIPQDAEKLAVGRDIYVAALNADELPKQTDTAKN